MGAIVVRSCTGPVSTLSPNQESRPAWLHDCPPPPPPELLLLLLLPPSHAAVAAGGGA